MLNDRIKSRRLELNMTQEELALKVGYKTKGAISRIENGDRDISQSQITAFAKALNTTEAYLMGWEETSTDILTLPPTTNPDYFTNAEEAIQFLMQQKVIAASTGINLDDYSEDEITQFANRLLDYARFLDSDKRK